VHNMFIIVDRTRSLMLLNRKGNCSKGVDMCRKVSLLQKTKETYPSVTYWCCIL
jgi:hypothetical protein